MLELRGKLLNVKPLEANGPYPPSCLITVFDNDAGESLNLVGDESIADALTDADELTQVVLTLRWKRIDLASLGGSGKGKAYRLRVVSASLEAVDVR